MSSKYPEVSLSSALVFPAYSTCVVFLSKKGASQYLDKAEYRLWEVETLIERGHICDVFIEPLLEVECVHYFTCII